MNIYNYLKEKRIITDGAFGTYFTSLYDTKDLPEKANTTNPENVRAVHTAYVDAGARLIRTNTFASNSVLLACDLDGVKKNITEAVNIAKEVAGDEVFVAADIGPIPFENVSEEDEIRQEYVAICETFLSLGIKVFVFETFSDIDIIKDTLEYIGDKAFVIVQFAVNQFGFSSSGLSARKLMQMANDNANIDASGFNCGVGPGHMLNIIKEVSRFTRKPITALPNAGYPQNIRGKMTFSDKNVGYFVDKLNEIADYGASIVGGCCGTTPEYIKLLNDKVKIDRDLSNESLNNSFVEDEVDTKNVVDVSFYANKRDKLIAVELAPPVNSNDEKILQAAKLLNDVGVDVLTFPDSPSGRTRADSVLMAEKIASHTNITVMPHICCRDKNAIAIRSMLLGAYMNDINNFLVVTGDPIPSLFRSKVKSVFNFDSVGLMNIIKDMNEEHFENRPIVFGGAINQTRKNLDIEIKRVKKKMEAGATFFLTQPVFDKNGADKLKRIKEETNARILCGIMPFVSRKNAVFMKNEMTGIEVSDEIIDRYREDFSKEEGEMTGVAIAKDVIELTSDYVDGYYFSFPFNRVHLLEKILE